MEVWIGTRERKKIDWAGTYHENDAELHHPQKFCQEGFYKKLVNILSAKIIKALKILDRDSF